jgi:polyisoprenoid-binding protein YceI
MAQYRIVPERSRIWAEVRSSVHPIRIEIDGLEGSIEAEIAGTELDLKLPLKARLELDSEQVKTGNGLYDRELERRLETRKYPTIRGELREVKPLDSSGRYHLRGDLSLHGVAHTVEGDVKVELIDGRTLEVDGDNEIDMRDFGLDPPRLLMLKVYPEVKIRGRVVAQRED